jgi:WD40 repeat protein
VCPCGRCVEGKLSLVYVQMDAHTPKVKTVGFSPDGSKIVSGGDDKNIKIWGGWRRSCGADVLV